MARIVPLWRSDAISVHRFDHPVEHEDQAYEEVSTDYVASFVETGTFDLAAGGRAWRVRTGDVMLQRPGLRFRASFEGPGFNDTCLTIVYLAANEDGFDPARSWDRANRTVLRAGDRLRYLQWLLARAVATGTPMLAEHCATEIFAALPEDQPDPALSGRKFHWYAERVRHACERMDADYPSALTASELARDAGMSMFHFSRVFAALTGAPPHRYLLKARLSAAARMLKDGRSVTETCYATGFNNLSHFTRSFARAHGRPPSRFPA
ncbi:MAG TPA: hypothetical protein DEA40_06715 [Parvularcula sp.]|nr:hypothetical protein [Parvularcula sp.]